MKCKYCGAESELDHIIKTSEYYTLMEDEGLCFNCAFWEKYARIHEQLNPDNYYVIAGGHYIGHGMVDRRVQGGFLGHGGHKFKIRIIATGEIIETNNLWHQGDVPSHFRTRLPDTALFIQDEIKSYTFLK